MCAFLSVDLAVDYAELPSSETIARQLEDDLLVDAFKAQPFTRSRDGTRLYQNMVDIVHSAGRSVYAYQSSHDERETVKYQEVPASEPDIGHPTNGDTRFNRTLKLFGQAKVSLDERIVHLSQLASHGVDGRGIGFSAASLRGQFSRGYNVFSSSTMGLQLELDTADPAAKQLEQEPDEPFDIVKHHGPLIELGEQEPDEFIDSVQHLATSETEEQPIIEETTATATSTASYAAEPAPADGSSLVHYWNEDKRRGHQHRSSVHRRHVIVMSMVDFYIQLRKIDIGLPILLRTLYITAPCGRERHRRYNFNSDNKLTYIVNSHSGSLSGERSEKTFNHPIWDFNNGAEVSLGEWSYKVYVRYPQSDSDYKFVLLMPIAREPKSITQLLLASLGVNPRYTHHSAYKGVVKTVAFAVTQRIVQRAFGPRFSPHEDLCEPVLLGCNASWSWRETLARVFCLAVRSQPPAAPPLRHLEVNVRGTRNSYSVLVVNTPGKKPVCNPTYAELVNRCEDDTLEVDETCLVHIALCGDFSGLVLDYCDFVKICSRERISAADAVEQFNQRVPADRAFLLDFLKDTKGNFDADAIPFLQLYECSNMNYIGPVNAKGMRPLMRPLVATPVGPMESAANEAKAVNTRLLAVMSGPSETLISPKITDYGREFIGHLHRHWVAATGLQFIEPWCYESVIEHQDTPHKRNTIETSICADDARPLRKSNGAFVKKENDGGECDGKLKAEPRIISTKERDKVKAKFLGYMYALKALLTTLPCSAVGRNVKEVEQLVQRVAQRSANGRLFEGDLSRQDGRKDIQWRVIFSAILNKFFKDGHSLKTQELHMLTVGMKMRTKHGHKYNSGFAEGSGVPDTTINNTLENIFLTYTAKRDEGYSSQDAWEWVLQCCGFAGDDSFGCDLKEASFVTAASNLHHKAKYKSAHLDGTLGFIGRKFGPTVRVLRTVVSSIQDPSRIMVKFTCCGDTLPDHVDRLRRLFDKARAVLTTDALSPYLSAVARCIICAGKREYDWNFSKNYDLNYLLTSSGETVTYHQEKGMWMDVLYRQAWPCTDLQGMFNYYSVPRSFEEIELHPVFRHDKHVPSKDLSIIDRPLNHTEPDEVVQYGKVNVKLATVNEDGTKHHGHPSNAPKYRKALLSAVRHWLRIQTAAGDVKAGPLYQKLAEVPPSSGPKQPIKSKPKKSDAQSSPAQPLFSTHFPGGVVKSTDAKELAWDNDMAILRAKIARLPSVKFDESSSSANASEGGLPVGTAANEKVTKDPTTKATKPGAASTSKSVGKTKKKRVKPPVPSRTPEGCPSAVKRSSSGKQKTKAIRITHAIG